MEDIKPLTHIAEAIFHVFPSCCVLKRLLHELLQLNDNPLSSQPDQIDRVEESCDHEAPDEEYGQLHFHVEQSSVLRWVEETTGDSMHYFSCNFQDDS